MKLRHRFNRLVRTAGVIAVLFAGLAQADTALADTLEMALQRGDANAARAALEAEVAGKPDAAIHRAHLEGLIAMRRGDLRTAEAVFRSILAKHPGFEPSRVQLVIVLDKLGDPKVRHEAQRLAETTKDAGLRARLARKAGARDQQEKSGVQFRFSVLPSSNLTGGPKTDTILIGGLPFRLDPGSRQAGGTGLSLGLVAWQSWDLSPDWQLTLSGSVDRRIYDTDAKADETEVGGRLALAHKTSWGGLSFGPRTAILFQGGELVRRQAGLGFETAVLTGSKTRLNFSAEVLRQRFPQTAYRDGTLSRGQIGLRWTANRDAEFHMNLPIERETAVADHLSHLELGIELGVQLRRGPVGIGLAVATSLDRYDGIYPGFDVARKDKVSSLKLSFRHDKLDWQGLVPELTVTRTRQDSNIPLHDSWTTDVGLNLVKRF
ncbi:surface lipoprotein assembly modifier [Tabrizicola sp.]|uniref:surface lipoprotein assembly modifier n=1 Tax=Tabrizicola sp. TaxID=2005166 RepID=UPI002735460E|nr:surface lipoprotein assembly modifier [Tabrizicola sp.]MDP3195417.1 surface lipoprotein assembly modifier [Tabrizicola sp.]